MSHRCRHQPVRRYPGRAAVCGLAAGGVVKFISLFDGISGFILGFERAGMECVGRAEVDRFCNELAAEHYPHLSSYGDVRYVTRETTGTVDLICGGFPCQDLSVAGKRAGLDGERSGLWFEFRRIIADVRPRWVVIENVPGLLSSNGGRDMGAIIEALAELGYGWAYRRLDAQYFGLAQRRKRIFIVGCLGDWTGAAQVLFEPESCAGDTPPSRETGEDVAGTIGNRIARSHTEIDGHGAYVALAVNARNNRLDAESQTLVVNGRQDPIVSIDHAQTLDGLGNCQAVAWEMSHASEAYRKAGDIAPTLQKRMGTGGNQVPLVGVRRLTPLECERLQGFPDGWTEGQSDTQRYRQLGNAVAVPVIAWIGRRIMEAGT